MDIDPELVSEAFKVVSDLPPRFTDESFPKQAAFINDPSKRKAALTPRRGGKTTGTALAILKAAWENPNTECLYVALTGDSAKYIMWRPVIIPLAKSLGVFSHANEVEKCLTLTNGSRVYLTGADASEKEIEKLRGRAFVLVVLDECASWRPHIRRLIEEVLEPTLIDKQGTLAMVGTPGERKSGAFYDITDGGAAGWSVHRWQTTDNPYMRDAMLAAMADLDKRVPDWRTVPKYRREYFGEWATDTETKVYQYKEQNLVYDLPKVRFLYSLGIDLGWDDPTAFVLMAHHQEHGKYIIDCYKKSGLVVDDINAIIRDYNAEHPLADIVIDNASKQLVEDMRARFGWHFKAAVKTDKLNQIGLFNSDLAAGRLKILEPKCQALLDEMDNLPWDTSREPRREDPRADNHLCDAALYVDREVRHIYKPTERPPKDQDAFERWQNAKWEDEDMRGESLVKEWWEV